MSQYTKGEFLDLYWENEPETLYVYGHVTPDEFRESVSGHYRGPGIAPVPSDPSHRWGAWRFDGQDDDGNRGRVLRTYDVRGRAMFPLTEASVSRWAVGPARDSSLWNAEEIQRMREKDESRVAFLNRQIGWIP